MEDIVEMIVNVNGLFTHTKKNCPSHWSVY